MIAGTLSSGLSYAVKKSGSAVAYCALSIRCGTRSEQDFPEGTAHFAEHTIFKGTAHRSAAQISSCLDRLGGELNAYTTKEEIVIHATVLKEDLWKAVKLLMELATEPSFPSKEVETERGVVLDEINSYKDSPADDIFDKFEEALFAGHPLGRSILGTSSSVRKIRCRDLHEFVKREFRPEKMALTIVADLDEAVMAKTAARNAAKYFPGNSEPLRPEPKAACVGTVRFDKTFDKHNHEANAVIGGAAPSLYEEKDRITAVLLCNLLGGPGSNSLLNASLREKHGWVYGVECAFTQYCDTGIMAISLGCDKENLELCFKEIDRIIHKLQTAPLSEARLKAAKKQLLGQLAVSSDNGETQALSMGKSMMAFGRISTRKEDIEAIEAVTATDLQSMAVRVFDKDNLSRMIFL